MRLAGGVTVNKAVEKRGRFYKDVSFKAVDDGYAILLDGRTARTRGQYPLIAPTKPLSEAVAEEWRAQADHIDQETMQLTALLSAAIDGAKTSAGGWVEDILAYLQSDLVCYRAETPGALVEKQQAVWDPYLVWLHREFGAVLVTTMGIVAVDQPDAAVATIRDTFSGLPAPVLYGVKTAAEISGSAVLALALWKRAFDPDAIFEASRLDERFQEQRWGVDAEAKLREERLHSEFSAVASFLGYL